MKNIIASLFLSMLFIGCTQKTDQQSNEVTQEAARTTSQSQPLVTKSTSDLTSLFTKADAEMILGEPAHVTDSTMGSQHGISAYRSSYTADASGTQQGAVHFLVESYRGVPDAQTKYSFIKASNENSPGFKNLDNIGDEAYFHSDNENFYFTMVRKGPAVMTLKVNKITQKTSLDNFNRIAQEISEKL